jgi:hypothetical protein
MSFGEIPRGIEDLGVYPLTADVAGSKVDVPGARSLAFNVESDSDELHGDNAVIAIVRNAAKLTGTIEVGRTNLAALAVMLGGTAATSGSTPNSITALDQSATAGSIYFQAQGQTYSQDATGSGYRVTLNKLLVTGGPNETLAVDEWSTPSLDFEGIAISGALLKRQNYETYTALA